jgi:hypothetical protein
VIHAFGAYFGIAATFFVSPKDTADRAQFASSEYASGFFIFRPHLSWFSIFSFVRCVQSFGNILPVHFLAFFQRSDGRSRESARCHFEHGSLFGSVSYDSFGVLQIVEMVGRFVDSVLFF